MQTLGTYVPDPTKSVTIPLLLREGYTEVINDSNYALTIQMQYGQVVLPPGVANIYLTPDGGGVLTITSSFFDIASNANVPGNEYLFADLGPADEITINQYEPNELIGQTYPYPLVRSVNTQLNAVGALQNTITTAAMSGGLTTNIAFNPNFPVSGHVWLAGIDVTIDQEATAHGYTLTYGPFNNGVTFTAVLRSQTTGAIQYFRTFDPPLPSQATGAGAIITATIPGVTGGTARGAMNIWGMYQ